MSAIVNEDIVDEVIDEIARAELTFGNQYTVPDVDQVLMTREGGCTAKRMAEEYEIPTADRARFMLGLAFLREQGTWAHILVEEVAEAIEAAVIAPDKLRAELIQVAAVAMRWVDAIDCRTPLPAHALNPDCAVGKRASCASDAWDDITDSATTCGCDCHQAVRP